MITPLPPTVDDGPGCAGGAAANDANASGGSGGGDGGGGSGGDGGGDGGGGQAEESSNLAMTLPPAWSTGPSIPLAVCHLRATDAGNMILGAASLGSTLAVSGVNLGPLA